MQTYEIDVSFVYWHKTSALSCSLSASFILHSHAKQITPITFPFTDNNQFILCLQHISCNVCHYRRITTAETAKSTRSKRAIKYRTRKHGTLVEQVGAPVATNSFLRINTMVQITRREVFKLACRLIILDHVRYLSIKDRANPKSWPVDEIEF